MKKLLICLILLALFGSLYSQGGTNELIIPSGTIISASMGNGLDLVRGYRGKRDLDLPIQLTLGEIKYFPDVELILKSNSNISSNDIKNLVNQAFAMCHALPQPFGDKCIINADIISYYAGNDIHKGISEKFKGYILNSNYVFGLEYTSIRTNKDVQENWLDKSTKYEVEILTFMTQNVYLVLTEPYKLKY